MFMRLGVAEGFAEERQPQVLRLAQDDIRLLLLRMTDRYGANFGGGNGTVVSGKRYGIEWGSVLCGTYLLEPSAVSEPFG
jgi:hypothetical protein